MQSTNMYANSANNPVMYSDISGMSPKTWMIIGSVALIDAGLLLISVGGSVLVAAGAGSLIGGLANEASGGKFESGWVGGLVAGAFLGAAGAVGAELLLLAAEAEGFAVLGYVAASIASSFGIAAFGGGLGSYFSQRMDHGPSGVEWDNVFSSSISYGVWGLLASFVPQGSSLIGVGKGFKAAFCVAGEIVIDFTSYIKEMIDKGKFKPIVV